MRDRGLHDRRSVLKPLEEDGHLAVETVEGRRFVMHFFLQETKVEPVFVAAHYRQR